MQMVNPYSYSMTLFELYDKNQYDHRICKRSIVLKIQKLSQINILAGVGQIYLGIVPN
jgi:hypothetical protein